MKLSNKWKRRLSVFRSKWRKQMKQLKLGYKGVEVELYDINKKAEPYFRYFSAFLLIVATFSIILSVGFNLTPYYQRLNEKLDIAVILGFVFLFMGRLLLTTRKIDLLKYRLFETILFGFILILGLSYLFNKDAVVQFFSTTFGITNAYQMFATFTKVYLVLIILAKFIQITPALFQMQQHPGRILTGSFMGIILIGALMLMLPRTTVDGQGLDFIDALFTSTSAVCVTGLIVVDTATKFTTMGQVIIMILIQLGGIGIVTFATFFALFISSGLGIGQMNFLKDIVQEEKVSETITTIRKIIGLTLGVEFIGAVGYFISWRNTFPDVGERMFYSMFHAVSAFCNAGFALFTNNFADPNNTLNWGVNITTICMIVIGGLGFTTLWEIFLGRRQRHIRHRKYSIHTQLVIKTTAILIIGGTLLILWLEWGNTLQGYSISDKIMISLFQSVTPRTAGFNTIPIDQLTVSTTMVILLLMAIGASPASTGGGIKTTSIAVLFLAVSTTIRGHDRIEYSKKTIPRHIIYTAITALMLAAVSLFVSTMLLTITENKPFMDLLFEEISAYSTVGLSRGITASLTDWGKLIIIFSMFIGRVGSVTVAAAFAERQEKKRQYQYPAESVIVA